MVLLDTRYSRRPTTTCSSGRPGGCSRDRCGKLGPSGPDTFLGDVPAGKPSPQAVSVRVALWRLTFGPTRRFYRWSVQTVFTSDACPRTCQDRARRTARRSSSGARACRPRPHPAHRRPRRRRPPQLQHLTNPNVRLDIQPVTRNLLRGPGVRSRRRPVGTRSSGRHPRTFDAELRGLRDEEAIRRGRDRLRTSDRVDRTHGSVRGGRRGRRRIQRGFCGSSRPARWIASSSSSPRARISTRRPRRRAGPLEGLPSIAASSTAARSQVRAKAIVRAPRAPRPARSSSPTSSS